jgi:hypothetical protein
MMNLVAMENGRGTDDLQVCEFYWTAKVWQPIRFVTTWNVAAFLLGLSTFENGVNLGFCLGNPPLLQRG